MKRCGECGAEIPPRAPGCPRCLLALGLSRPEGERFGEFELACLIGRGGMGAVYRARQPRLAREVALKLIPLDAALQPGLAERFGREARALAGLCHPRIVALHDFGEAEGQSYLVLELVRGGDLEQALAGGPLEAQHALEIAIAVCDALAHAHARGVVHRDIKPGNVLLDEQGGVKVTDFGLAKLLDADGALLTGSLQSMGTPFYAAPEQRRGAAEVDRRADLYSVGVLLYRMLTGELPAGAYPPPSQVARVDRRVDAVLQRAMQVDPLRRYQQAEELRAALEACRAPQRRPLLPVVAVALGLPLLLLVALRQDRAVAPAPAAPAVPRDVTPLGERYYRVFYEHLSWHAARRRCEQMGGRLAIADHPRIASLLARLSRSHVWIGATDEGREGDWRWVDGSPVRYANWAPGEPNNLDGEHYGIVSKYGQWNDLPADSPLVKGFICEWDRSRHPGPLQAATAAQLQALLRRANPDYDGHGRITLRDGRIVELDLAHARVRDISPLRGLPLVALDLSGTAVADLGPLERLPLQRLALGRSAVHDLAPLEGLPLAQLKLNGTAVRDLSPLRGMRLVYLDISHTRVRDLSPLRGMPLSSLHMNRVPAADLEPLRGLPLVELGLLDVLARTLDPLAGCTRLELLHVPGSAPGLDTLRTLPRLRQINNQPATAFWAGR